jgi:hypothetical protein
MQHLQYRAQQQMGDLVEMTYQIHDPLCESGWLRKEDLGETGSQMTLAMAEGLEHLIYELKVSLEETVTNNYIYLARCEMELVMKLRTGAMVPLRLREALEILKDLSPLSRSAQRRSWKGSWTYG